MDNPTILKILEQQRDSLFNNLNTISISGLYKEQYDEIKAGRMFIFDNGDRQTLSELKKLMKDTTHDATFKNKIAEYLRIDNNALITYFKIELEKVFVQIRHSGKQEEIQAMFIVYDYYYYFTSNIFCYGLQEYPLIEKPRYITNEYDYNKQILFLDNGIHFQPAWLDCEELGNLDYLDINYKLEELFKLNSRVLLHKALEMLDSEEKLTFIQNRPFSFYINEHDSEVMILYRLH